MLKRVGKIGTLVLVVTLLLLNGSAHEFVHSFTGHEDTTHCRHPHEGKAYFDTEHHHCAMLDLQLPVFLPAATPVPIPIAITLYFPYQEAAGFSPVLLPVFSTLLRGPPVTELIPSC